MRKLNLVVTCSDRKSLPVSPALQVRSLTTSTTSDRVVEWRDRFSDASRRVPLSELYQGEHWSQVRRLAATAARAGFDTALWVASAGVGLRPETYRSPAYGATFAGGQADTVGPSAKDRQSWWAGLHTAFRTIRLAELSGDAALMIVLSASYGEALEHDLSEVALSGSEAVLIGGHTTIPGLTRVSANGRLRSRLGGTHTSLNSRMAAAWLENLEGRTLTDPTVERSWSQWTAAREVDAPPARQKLRDDQVREFIRSQQTRGAVSKSRLLELLRDSGLACEQRRFGALYEEVGSVG